MMVQSKRNGGQWFIWQHRHKVLHGATAEKQAKEIAAELHQKVRDYYEKSGSNNNIHHYLFTSQPIGSALSGWVESREKPSKWFGYYDRNIKTTLPTNRRGGNFWKSESILIRYQQYKQQYPHHNNFGHDNNQRQIGNFQTQQKFTIRLYIKLCLSLSLRNSNALHKVV